MDTAVVATLRPQTWSSPKIELRQGSEGLGVFALAAIEVGEVLVCLRHVFVDKPERHTIQLDEHVHQAGTGEMDDYFNHSCDPNAYLDFQRVQFVARKPIVAGEEISFNYLTSEWDMAAPFTCGCGTPACVGEIRGFLHLTPEQREVLVPWISPYLQRRLADLPSSERKTA
jgi:SET domain-containing protein